MCASHPFGASAPDPDVVQWTPEEDGALLRVTFQSGKGNILDVPALESLTAVLAETRRPGVKAMLLEGAGPHFSYGASVEDHRPEKVAAFLRRFHDLFRALIQTRCPVLGVVRGCCLGGGLELAAFCHRLFAAPDAKLGQPEIKLGVFAPVASLLLPHRVGQPAADDLLLTGRVVNAEEACRIGLVDEVADDPREAARDYARRHLLALSSSSLRYAVAAARHGMTARLLEDLDRVEALYLDDLMQTEDAVEGIQAFLDKRPPRFDQEAAGTTAGEQA